MTNYTVSSGQTLSGITLTGGSQEPVYAGGKALNTGGASVDAILECGGADLIVSSGGSAVSTTLNIGGTIDLVALAFSSGGCATVNTATDPLTVNEGGQIYVRQLAGTYSGDSFQLAPDVSGGTLIIA